MVANIQLRMTVYASLMAALIATGALVAIPIGPVPIVLQNMFVFLGVPLNFPDHLSHVLHRL